MSNDLFEGCKAMIIGGRTADQQSHTGKVVTCKVFCPLGKVVVFNGAEWLAVSQEAWIIEGDGSLFSTRYDGAKGPAGLAIWGAKYLMPLPPMEDPSIDDCTFTPIKQKETEPA